MARCRYPRERETLQPSSVAADGGKYGGGAERFRQKERRRGRNADRAAAGDYRTHLVEEPACGAPLLLQPNCWPARARVRDPPATRADRSLRLSLACAPSLRA